MSRAPLSALDFGIWAALLLGTFALYDLTFQPLLFGDGPQLLQTYLHRDQPVWMHALYFPFTQALEVLRPGPRAIEDLQLTSSLSAAAAVSGAFVLARLFSCTPVAATLSAVLLALAPACWFFATCVEIHCLHLACVVFVALVIMLVPWRRPTLALSLSALACPLLYLSHKSGILLGPGLVLLVAVAAQRQGLPPRVPFLLFVAGPALLAGLIAGMLLTQLHLHGTLSLGVSETMSFIETFQLGWKPSHLWTHLVQPLGLLAPLAVVGCFRCTTRLQLAALLSLILPGIIYFQWYGEQNHGGYLLGGVAFVALLAGRALIGSPWIVLLGIACLIPQVLTGRIESREGRDPVKLERLKERAAAARKVLGERGMLVSADPDLQPVTILVPGIEERSLANDLLGVVQAGTPVDAFAANAGVLMDRFAKSVGGPVALDLGYRETDARAVFGPYMTALEKLARRRFQTTESGKPPHKYLQIRK